MIQGACENTKFIFDMGVPEHSPQGRAGECFGATVLARTALSRPICITTTEKSPHQPVAAPAGPLRGHPPSHQLRWRSSWPGLPLDRAFLSASYVTAFFSQPLRDASLRCVCQFGIAQI